MTTPKNLTDSDLENLRRSFITPELAKQAGLFRVSNSEGAALVGRSTKSGENYAGIAFPYFDPFENGRLVEYRLRRDKPPLEHKPDGSTKETAKYLTPFGRRNLLYFPPGTTADDIFDTSIPVVIVEGEKKTLAVKRFCDETARRALVVGLGGVSAWRAQVGTEPGEDGKPRPVKGMNDRLARIAWGGRDVTVIFDSNITKEAVFWARHGLAKELSERGAKVFYVDLPELSGVNGPDDLLFHKGAGFLEALLLNRRPAFKRDANAQATTGSTVEPRRMRLMSADDLASLPPPEWLLTEIALPKNDLCVLFGPPGSGKTFVAADIAFSVSQPAPVHNNAAEEVGTLQSRLEAWKTFHKVQALPNLFFLPEAVNLLDAGAVGEFIGIIGDVKPALVIVDTLARCMVGGDENSAKDMGGAVESLDLIRRATGAAVLVVHHTTKGTQTERGSSALRGAAHTMISLSNDDGLIALQCDKNRGGQDFDSLYFRLVEAGSPELAVPIRATKVETRDAPLTKLQAETLRTVADSRHGVSFSTLVTVLPHIAKGTLWKCVNKCERLGLVSKDKKGAYAVTESGRWILETEDDREARRATRSETGGLNWQIPAFSAPIPDAQKSSENHQEPVKWFPLEKGDEEKAVSTEFPLGFHSVSTWFPPSAVSLVSTVSTPPIGGGNEQETGNPETGNNPDDGGDDQASQSLRAREAAEFVEKERADGRTDDEIRQRAGQVGIRRSDLICALKVFRGAGTDRKPPETETEEAATVGRKRVKV